MELPESIARNALPLLRYLLERERHPELGLPEIPEISEVIGLTPDAIKAARAVPTVYLETCGSGGAHNGVKNAVDGARPDRVLFGTDMPLLDARHQVAKAFMTGRPVLVER